MRGGERSCRFHGVLRRGVGSLGVKNLGAFGDAAMLYGTEKPAFLVLKPGNGEAPSGNGVTIGFAAASPADVDAFHAAGLAAGGVDEDAIEEC